MSDDDRGQSICPTSSVEAKGTFWTHLVEVTDSIPKEERVAIWAYFNGHFGEGNMRT